MVRHSDPSSNAFSAASTATSTSAASDSATWQMISPVEGSSTGNVLPDTAGTKVLLMNNCVCRGWTGLVVEVVEVVEVVVEDEEDTKVFALLEEDDLDVAALFFGMIGERGGAGGALV